MSTIIMSIVILAALGILIGILLGVAGKVFAVETDEKVVQVRECLPGNNCGGCGYPGCDGLAEAIAAGEASIDACPVGGAAVAQKIGKIMGVETEESVKKVAYVRCAGTCEKASSKYNYVGEMSCKDAMMVPGQGEKACSYGCLGLGPVVSACQFDALSDRRWHRKGRSGKMCCLRSVCESLSEESDHHDPIRFTLRCSV